MPVESSSTATSTTTTTVKPPPCTIEKKSNEKSEEKPQNDKKDKETTKKPKASRRRRRSVSDTFPTGSSCKRCIGKLNDGAATFRIPSFSAPKLSFPTFDAPSFTNPFLFSPLLGAANPRAEEAEVVAAPNPIEEEPALGAPAIIVQPSFLDSTEDEAPVQAPAEKSSKNCDRYENDMEVAATNIEVKKADNHAEESMLQAIPTKKQLFAGASSGERTKRLNFFKKSKSKNENLLHGKIINSIESNEISIKPTSEVDASSTVPPFVDPNLPKYESDPKDYLPTFEYFPQNSPSFYQHQSTYPPNFNPSSFKSSPMYDRSLIPSDVSHTTKRYSDKTSGCRCDPEQFDDLLHHMQSSYAQFHDGIIQLFDTFKSQASCGSVPQIDQSRPALPAHSNLHSFEANDHKVVIGPSPIKSTPFYEHSLQSQLQDSSGSPSHSNFDYNTHCVDKNAVNADPQLSKLCENAFNEANPSSGYYNPPSGVQTKTGGFENQLMTYADFIKMMQNVNKNSGTVLSSAFDLDDDDDQTVGQYLPEDLDQINNQLRQHISDYKVPDPVEAVGADSAGNDSGLSRFNIKSFMDGWRKKI